MLLLWLLIPFLCVATADPHTTQRTVGKLNAQKIQTHVLTSCLVLPLALACCLASSISEASGSLEESDADKMEAKTPNGAWIFFETCGSFHKLCFAIAPQNTGPRRSELHQGSEHCRGGEHKQQYNWDVQNERKKNDMDAAAVKQMIYAVVGHFKIVIFYKSLCYESCVQALWIFSILHKVKLLINNYIQKDN